MPIEKTAVTFGPMMVDWERRVDMSRMRAERAEKVSTQMRQRKIDYLLLLRMENARYAAGIKRLYWPTIQLGGGPLLFLPQEGEPSVWVIDPEFAKKTVDWLGDGHFHTPYQMDIADDVRRFVADAKADFGANLADARIAVDIWSPAMREVFAEELPGAEFVNGQELMLAARQIKTADEVACMKVAYAISEAGLQAALDKLKPGVRECELVGACFQKMWELGTETTQCSEVVNSGAASHPYRRFHTDRIVQAGDLVNMDFGGCFSGYFGDFCRAFVCGTEPSAAQRDLLRRAHELQMEALEALGPDASPAQLCEKLGRKTLGHGIGISAFEGPHLRAVDDYEMKPGMTFSVTTPPLGADGVGGVHLEDEIVITESGVDLYSTFPYTL